MSKVYKSSIVTLDENRRVTIDVAPIVPEVDESSGFSEDEYSLEPEEEIITPEMILEKAHDTAARIIDEAESKAAAILDDARIKAREEMEDAIESGRQEGYDAGVREAEGLKLSAEETVREAWEEKERILAQAEPEVVNLISRIVSGVLMNEAEYNPEIISILVKSGLSQATLTGNITIKVSKHDYEDLLSQKEEILSSFEGMANIEFSQDLALKKSGCIIETDFGSVDCGLGSQLRELTKNLDALLKDR